MFIEGRYRIEPALPQVAGLEEAGTVAAAGDGAQTPVGARVAFRHPGSWAEFAAVPEGRLYRVPDEIPSDSAAQFSLNPVTAWALLDELDAQPGDWIAINAASSSSAQLVSGLCRRRGELLFFLPATVLSPCPHPVSTILSAGVRSHWPRCPRKYVNLSSSIYANAAARAALKETPRETR